MPTFVYMTRCDGCGNCVDICPSDIMHIDKTYRRAYNIEPNMCWECYSCVKACPQPSHRVMYTNVGIACSSLVQDELTARAVSNGGEARA